MDLLRYILLHRGTAKSFWLEALATAIYMGIRVSSKLLPPHTRPFHRWNGAAHNLSYLATFGAAC